MIERLTALSPRQKAIIAAALIVLVPLAALLGYRFGYFLAGH